MSRSRPSRSTEPFHPDHLITALYTTGASEPTIRVVSVDDISDLRVFKGHAKSVRSVAFDPRGDFLASSSIDGSVRIWDLRDASDNPCVKELKGVLAPSDVDSLDRCSVHWAHDGKKFAFPGRKDVMVVENETWLTLYTVSGSHSGPVDIVAWNPNGHHLATIDKSSDCQVLVWDTRQKAVVAKVAAKHRVLGFAWDSTGQSATFVDVEGTMTTWKSVLSKDRGDGAQVKAKASEAPALKSLFDDEVKESVGNGRSGKRIRGLDSDDDGDSESEEGSKDAVLSDEDGVGDGFVVDDDGAGYAEYGIDIPKKAMASRARGPRNRFADTDFALPGAAVVQTSYQKPFQPGATPMKPGKTTRYLAFNLTGLIYTIDQSTHSTVHVEFHDRSAQRPFSFTDHYNYTLATLGDRGALFACESALGSPSRIFYHPFESWATKSDWQAELSTEENVKAIALSTRGAHVATDRHYLRSFSYAGVQTHVMCLPGPIVCLCAGADDTLLVVFTAGTGVARTHNLGYMLYDVSDMTCLRKDSLPVSPGADLQWVGYSETGNVSTYDSTGILRMLMPHSDFIWVPMLDTRAAKGDKVESYWAVGLTATEFMCVIVKGAGDPFPTYPNRLISQLPLQAPLLHLSTPSGAMEEDYFRRKLHAAHLKGTAAAQGTLEDREAELLLAEKEMDKLLLKLIQAAVKAEKLQRALDLTTQLNLPRSVDGAVKIAISDHFPGLAERMNLIKEAKMIRSQAEEEQKLAMLQDGRHVRSRPDVYLSHASPDRPQARIRDDHLEAALFADDHQSRPFQDPHPQQREPEEVRPAARKHEPAERPTKKPSNPVERPKQTFNPFAVASERAADSQSTGASNLLNAMDESERQKAGKGSCVAVIVDRL
ncbi:hypothetical protein DFJ74DRAFT_339799 [Hyaloraphidium curvatum]|nr:hypothetical protein DFJ74DRAFT_339799 [Hyaloraphidium curvatum]